MKFRSSLCWALWSLVVFDLDDDPTQNNVTWFLMEDFLRISPYSGAQAVALDYLPNHVNTVLCV